MTERSALGEIRRTASTSVTYQPSTVSRSATQPGPPTQHGRASHSHSYGNATSLTHSQTTLSQADDPPIVRIGDRRFVIDGVLQQPSSISEMMCEGVRILKDEQGNLFVEKRLRMNTEEKRERANAEMKALMQISNAGGSLHINRVVDAVWSSGAPYASILLEFCNGGTLEGYIRSFRNSAEGVSEEFCWHTLSQVSAALAMCHTGARDPSKPDERPEQWNTICHLDIKPANIFLDNKLFPGHEHSKYPTLVLGDFGCSLTKDSIINGSFDKYYQPYGTSGYFPPESSDRTVPFGKHTDIWQLGGLIHVMCRQLETPNPSASSNGRPCGSRYSSALNTGVLKCMDRKVAARPSALEVAKQVARLSRP